MNALLAVCIVGAWPQLPPERTTSWPELPPQEKVVLHVTEEGRWSVSREAEKKGGWLVLLEDDEHSSETSVEVEFEKPSPTEDSPKSAAWKTGDDGRLIRLPGPSYRWPHQGCLMCLGIHLNRTHRVTNEQLSELGHVQWDVLHCNLHNLNRKEVVSSAGTSGWQNSERAAPLDAKSSVEKKSGCSGGACSSPSRARWRGMFR